MGKELKTYYDFATNDYEFLMDAYRAGFVSNAMGAMAQGICEKYLKHVINEYVEVVEKCRKEIDSFVSYHTGERHE